MTNQLCRCPVMYLALNSALSRRGLIRDSNLAHPNVELARVLQLSFVRPS